jgi:hypothetical protein
MKTCLGTAPTKKPDRMAYPVQDSIYRVKMPQVQGLGKPGFMRLLGFPSRLVDPGKCLAWVEFLYCISFRLELVPGCHEYLAKICDH